MQIKNLDLDEINRRIQENKENPTPSERLMIEKLTFNKIKFEFQYPVETKTSWFIADFFIESQNLIIEIDGASHDCRKDYDKMRDIFMKGKGYSVLRIKAWEVDTFDTKKLKNSKNFEVKKITIKRKKEKEKEKKKLEQKAILINQKIKEEKKKELVQKKLAEINKKKYPYL